MATASDNLREKLDKEIYKVVKRSSINKKIVVYSKRLTYAEFLSNKMLMIMVIREGVPYTLFRLIKELTPFDESSWAYFLDLSTKSLQRYKQSSKTFRSIQSEKIIEMAEVTSVGLDVFGDMEKFKLWLDTPNYALGKLTPLELLKDSYGKELVISELTRINYGILN